MNKNFNAFKVKFASKGFLKKELNSCQISGDAYYVLNSNNTIVKQFIQLDYATFRPTDIEMQTTSYYTKRSNLKTIRKVILENIQLDLGYDKNKISKSQKIRITIPINNLLEINKLLIDESKIKSSIDIFTGSNSSGSESNPTFTDIVAYENNDEVFLNGINFTNPLNNEQLFKKEKISIDSINDLNLISLKEFIELKPNVKQLIKEFNYVKYFIFNDIDNSEIDFEKIYQNISIENKIKSKSKSKRGNKEFFVSQVKDVINDFPNNFNNEERNKIVNKLRSYQKTLIGIEKTELIKKYPQLESNYFNNFIDGQSYPNCEYAHIFPVHIIKNQDKSEWFKIADNNNCLLLSPNIHKMLDNHQIIFNENGYALSLDNQVIKDIKLKPEILNTQRKKYIKQSLKQFKSIRQ